MKKKMFNFKTILISAVLCLCSLVAVSFFNEGQSDDSIFCMNNVGATKCWKGTCGHKSNYYSYGEYTQKSRTTVYYYTGYYLDPKVTQTVSFSKTVTRELSVGGEIGTDKAKAALGFTGGLQKTYTAEQSLTNETKKRKYVHIGIEFARRSNTVTRKKRTYDPGWHITATKKYCKYKTYKAHPECKLSTGCGLSLRSAISNG